MKLPNKPSELIRIAITDLKKAEKSSKYKIHMGSWHTPAYNKCEICFAGSVMAFSLKRNPQDWLLPEDFTFKTEQKLEALNAFRTGQVDFGLNLLNNRHYLKDDYEIFNRDVIEYNKSPTKFKRQMLNLATDLENFGL